MDMETARERELAAEVERLRAEVMGLRTEVTALRAEGAKRTVGANAARSARAAKVDDLVVEAVRDYIQQRVFFDVVDLRLLGYPHFSGWPHLRRDVAADLNGRKIPAPRGGAWSAKQVGRALLRHAAHALARPPLLG